jgi:hypothetical protein
MLRPRVSVGDQFSILMAAVKIVAWLLNLIRPQPPDLLRHAILEVGFVLRKEN